MGTLDNRRETTAKGKGKRGREERQKGKEREEQTKRGGESENMFASLKPALSGLACPLYLTSLFSSPSSILPKSPNHEFFLAFTDSSCLFISSLLSQHGNLTLYKLSLPLNQSLSHLPSRTSSIEFHSHFEGGRKMKA